jgi:hypothetical protein
VELIRSTTCPTVAVGRWAAPCSGRIPRIARWPSRFLSDSRPARAGTAGNEGACRGCSLRRTKSRRLSSQTAVRAVRSKMNSQAPFTNFTAPPRVRKGSEWHAPAVRNSVCAVHTERIPSSCAHIYSDNRKSSRRFPRPRSAVIPNDSARVAGRPSASEVPHGECSISNKFW